VTIHLEILAASYVFAQNSVESLNTKELVPQMMIRRRLTQGSKLSIELISKLNVKGDERVICGSSFGELPTTASILNALYKKEPISPTDFQNSVYNTAVSYFSILNKNKSEMLTISSGDETSLKVLRAGALKAIDGDELILVCFETLNIENIEQVNKCIDYLESAVALRVKITQKEANMAVGTCDIQGIPNSISHMLYVAKQSEITDNPILGIDI
jgi:hypothetical protein